MGELIIQLLPALILGSVYAALVFVMAQKRKVNPWPWGLATMIPFFGLLVAAVFFFLTMLSMLDRLNALEEQGAVATFS